MKNTDFFEAMGHLDDCILEAADAAISKKVKFNIMNLSNIPFII